MAAKKDSTNEEVQQDLTTSLPDDEATTPVEEPAAAVTNEEVQQDLATSLPDDEATTPVEEPAAAVTADGISLLDRSKDYGEVYGMAGVTYTQGDKYFNREGLEVTPQLEA